MIQLYKLSEVFLLVLAIVAFAFGQPNTFVQRTGHSSDVETASFSPDNKMLASVSKDGLIIVWNLATSKEIFKINPTENEKFGNPVFSPDGKILAGLSCIGFYVCREVVFWDAKSGKSTGSLNGNFSDVKEISFSPDKKTIAVADDTNISIWDVTTKEELQTFDGATAPMAFDPGGTVLAASNGEEAVELWNLKSGDKARTIEEVGKVSSFIFNPEGNLLATVIGEEDDDGNAFSAKLRNALTGEEITSFTNLKTSGLCAFTKDGKSLIVSRNSQGSDSIISQNKKGVDFSDTDTEDLLLFNLLNGRKQGTISIETKAVGKLGGKSQNGELLTVINGVDIYVLDLNRNIEISYLKGYSTDVKSIVFSRDVKALLSGYADGSIIWWDMAAGKIKKAVKARPRTDTSYSNDDEVTILPGGDFFIFAGKLEFYSITDGNYFGVKNWDDIPELYNYDFNPNGKSIAGLSEETVTIYEVPSGKILNRFVHQMKTTYGSRMAFSHDSKILAITDKPDIIFWDVSTGKVIKTLKDVIKESTNLAFSPDNKFLLLSIYPSFFQEGLKVIDLSANKVSAEIKPLVVPNNLSPTRTVYFKNSNICISPDSKMLAVLDQENKINFFSLADGKLFRTTKPSDGTNYREAVLVFSADGSMLAVGSDKGITLYKTATGEKIRSMQ